MRQHRAADENSQEARPNPGSRNIVNGDFTAKVMYENNGCVLRGRCWSFGHPLTVSKLFGNTQIIVRQFK